jgi:formylglycine-generating enzyme required for sulfatase activity
MMFDQEFCSPQTNEYTLKGFLDKALKEFGGFDSIVLWHAYPRIGYDDRNQFDFYREMPGGLNRLHLLVQGFHQRGVKVFIDYNPWDQGTRREPVSDLDALADLVKTLDVDGVYLDTMGKGPAEFRAKLDAVRPGIVLDSEGVPPLENIQDQHMSWAFEFHDSFTPGILRNKWLERRHMQHQIWWNDRDRTGQLHSAWMNGSGMVVSENEFGNWVGWSPRDKSILRSMLPIQRRYARLFSGEAWTPLVPTEVAGLFASLWEGSSDTLRIWTLANRSNRTIQSTLLRVASAEGARYFDLIRGCEAETSGSGSEISIAGVIRPRGIAAFAAGTDAALGSDFRQFLASQKEADSHADFRLDFPARKSSLRLPTQMPKSAPASIFAAMAEIPPVVFNMEVIFRVRECGFYDPQTEIGVDRENRHKPLMFWREVRLSPYAIDITPVTNLQFATFLKESGYRPTHADNFLKHWKHGAPPDGKKDHPVVYVDLDDARAYAHWAGKRLPTEEEWQYAAQGPDLLLYPWGNEMKPGVCNGGESGDTTSVTAFPAGRSPFGCYDMCGNVWEWTESERSDGRTRFCILKGGSFYKATGSEWYADGGQQTSKFASKFLLMWPGLDRCGTIGFRCAADVAES